MRSVAVIAWRRKHAVVGSRESDAVYARKEMKTSGGSIACSMIDAEVEEVE